MLILIGVPFALWGIQNYFETGKEKPVAKVGSHEIFERDVNRAYEQTLSTLVGIDLPDEAQLKQQTTDRLIRDELIGQDLVDKGMVVGDADVRAFIETLPYFKTDGKFDNEKFKMMLSSQGMSSAQFVAQVRKAIGQEHYQRGLTDSAIVTPNMLREFYRLSKQQRRVEYLTVAVQPNNDTFSPAEIEAYYQAQKADFQKPAEIAVDYLAISLEEIGQTVKPTEDELKQLYEEQKNQAATPERRKVAHILISVTEADAESDQKAKAKADEIKAKLDQGGDFAQLAKASSDDKVSAEKGGDLGFITRDAMEPNFANVAFELQQGGVSSPVKTSFGYHIIKVAEIEKPKTKSFDEMRDELVKNFQRSSAENKFYEKSQTLTEQAFEHPESLEAAATALGLTIQHTDYFTRDKGAGIAAEEAVRKAAFSDDVLEGRNSEAVEVGGDRVYLLHVKDHRPATELPLAEVQPLILERLRQEKGKQAALQTADNVIEQLKAGRSVDDLGKELKLTVAKPAAFTRGGAAGLPLELVATVFKSPRPAAGTAVPSKLGLENGDQIVYVLQAVDDGQLDSVDPKERELARDFLGKNTAQSEFSAFVAALRADGDVVVNKPAEE